mgnify:CR=1 FL=1
MSESLIRKHSQPFVLYRGGEQIGEVAGAKDAGTKEITFVSGVEVLMGDWLEDKRACAWLHVTDVTHDKLGSWSFVQAMYETGLDYRRQEAATAKVIATLEDIAEAIWTITDKKMPPEEKNRAQELLQELNGIVRSLPQPVAAQLAGQIASRFINGG